MQINNRSRNLAILAICLFASLVSAMALVINGPGRGAPARQRSPAASLQVAWVQAREAARGVPQAIDVLDRTLPELQNSLDAAKEPQQAALLGQVRASAATIIKARKDVLNAYAMISDIENLARLVLREAEAFEAAAGSQSAVTAQIDSLRTITRSLLPEVRGLLLGPGKPSDIANELGQREIDAAQILLRLQTGDTDVGLKPLAGERALDGLARLNVAKDNLFTRVRDVRALGDRLDLVQQATRQLDAAGPRLFAAGTDAAVTGGRPSSFHGVTECGTRWPRAQVRGTARGEAVPAESRAVRRSGRASPVRNSLK